MDRLDLFIKTVVGLITGFISMMIGGLGLVFTVLIGLMALDFISGLIAGAFNEGLRSATGIKGLLKKVYIILLIGSVYLVELAVLKSNGVVTDGISGAFCVIEFVSILENGDKLGIPMPQKLRDLVATMKNKSGDKN